MTKEQIEADYQLRKAELNKQITDLEQKMQEASAKSRNKLEGMLDTIKEKRDNLREKGEELKESSSESWNKVAKSISDTTSQIEMEMQKLGKELEEAIH